MHTEGIKVFKDSVFDSGCGQTVTFTKEHILSKWFIL
jgi:hypothetical protein